VTFEHLGQVDSTPQGRATLLREEIGVSLIQLKGVGSVGQAHPKPVWHLSRGHERPCTLSNRELLLFAKLGHLRADDLLWRPDFDGWRTVRSLLAHVAAPPLPRSISLSERPKQIGVKGTPLLSGYQKKPGSPGLIDVFLGRAEHPRNLAGLLVAVVLVGVLCTAMHKSFATDPQMALQASTEPYSATELYAVSSGPHSASTEPQQPTKPATANAVKPSESTRQAESEEGIIVRKVRVFSIDMLQPSDASALVPNPVSEGPSNAVPLPTKKPARMSQAPVLKPPSSLPILSRRS
jgi:hypothetical protein